MTDSNRELALWYHRRLPAETKASLNARGIADLAIHAFRIGWNDGWITIPVNDRSRRVAFFVFVSVTEGSSARPEIVSCPQDRAELYGWERVAFQRDELVICDGVLDRLVLESHGIPAVTSVGPDGFLPEWAAAFRGIPNLFICFRADALSQHAASEVARLIPRARIAQLPTEVGVGGTVTDFFVRLGNGREDFISLLESAVHRPGDTDASQQAA